MSVGAELARWAGLTNPSGRWYLAWSGVVGDLPMLAAVGVLWRHLNCHQPYCHRIARHHITVDGVTHRACRAHLNEVHTRAKETP